MSNRGPAVFGRDEEGRRTARRGGGGLVTALDSLAQHHDVTWIASAISEEDRRAAAESEGAALEERSRGGFPYHLRLVAHDPAAYDSFYNVVANPVLWFVQHRLWDLPRAPSFGGRFRDAWEHGYRAVNENFADAVTTEIDAAPGSTVFFHDYHLYLAPHLVRAHRPEATLAHFVHVPWVDADSWRVLPDHLRRAVHDGVLANDLVGFHTDRWRHSFLDAAVEILDAERDGDVVVHEGRRTHTVARPISVDTAEFDALAEDGSVLEAQAEIRRRRPELLVVRVDRTDPSKNVVRGFRAFECLLESDPGLVGRAGMLALLDPSRQEIPEYSAYLAEIEQAASDVNARFGREGWLPIELAVGDDFPRSVAAYKEYDVLFVNAIFDGLNLVAKEGPLVNERDGVLVLSENAGAHEELAPWAVTVNPFDVAEQAEALRRALAMPPEERRARRQAIQRHIREHDLGEWVEGLLADLDRVSRPGRR